MLKSGRLLFNVSAAIISMAVAVPANAADLASLARDAVFDICPVLMELETPLAEEESVTSLGYLAEAVREHPRMGTLDVVTLTADDGRIWIANSRDASFCQVGLKGEGARVAYDTLFADRSSLDGTLVPDEATTSLNPQLELTTLRTPAIDGIFYGVQFMDASALDANAPLIIQQYLLEEE